MVRISRREVHSGSWCGDLKERPVLQGLEVEGTIMFNRSSRKVMEDVDWIYLARDVDKWRALVNAVMNLRVP